MSQSITPASPALDPKAGEVWQVNLEPVEGSEQGKTRPVVVMSEPPTGRATIRLCAPVIRRKPVAALLFWCVELAPDPSNGLTKTSSADAAQTRALDVTRFGSKLGQVTPDELKLIAAALCHCVTPLTP